MGRPNPWFDSNRLAEWMTQRLHGGQPVEVVDVTRIPGGLSAESYRVTARFAGEAEDRRLVLRRDPTGGPVERHIEVEYRVMEALRDGPIPLPRVLALELDVSWLERPFFVDELVPGTADRNLFNSEAYRPFRPRLGEQFVDLLAKMHTLDLAATGLDALPNPGPGTAPAAHEVAVWEDLIFRLRQEPNPLLVEAFAWMKANLPVAPRISLVHGEYRPGNFMYVEDRIVAVMDWEFAHLGDPVEDLGWAFAKQFRVGENESGFYPREEFLQRYEAQAGFAVDRAAVVFWEVFSNVKIIGIGVTGQHAFRHRRTNLGDLAIGPRMNCAAEVAKLIGIGG